MGASAERRPRKRPSEFIQGPVYLAGRNGATIAAVAASYDV